MMLISRISTATGMHTSAMNPHSRLQPKCVRQVSATRRDSPGNAATSNAVSAIRPRVQNQPGPLQRPRSRSRTASRAGRSGGADAAPSCPGSIRRSMPPATCAAGSLTSSAPLR